MIGQEPANLLVSVELPRASIAMELGWLWLLEQGYDGLELGYMQESLYRALALISVGNLHKGKTHHVH